MTVKLRYIGPDPAVTGQVPLPEGWPALDHDEPDEELAAEKLAHRVRLGTNKNGSTHYGPHTFEEWTEPKADEPPADAPEADEPQAEGEPSAEAEV